MDVSVILRKCIFANITYVDSILQFDRPGIGIVSLYLGIEGVVFIIMTILIEVREFLYVMYLVPRVMCT